MLLGTCQKLAGGRGREKWAVKRGGGGMQIYARDRVEVHPQKKKKVLYLVKKKEEQRNIMDINCEVLNKHLLFIYKNAIESYCNYE